MGFEKEASLMKLHDIFRDSVLSDDAPLDYIITGGVDDLVKVWDLDEDGHLKLKHQLEGHSLGIVSVAISNDGKCKYSLILKHSYRSKRP